MSGFFRRIVKQASGQEAPVVHSTARLPFASPPALLEMEGSAHEVRSAHESGVSPDAAPPQTRPSSVSQVEEAAPRGGMQSASVGVRPEKDEGTPPPSGKVSREGMASRHGPPWEPVDPWDPLPASGLSVAAMNKAGETQDRTIRFPREIVARQPTRAAPQVGPDPDPGSADPEPRSGAGPRPGPVESESRVGDPGPRKEPGRSIRPGADEEVLPSRISPWEVDRNDTGERHPDLRRGLHRRPEPGADETTEVHVHIGRIEVTAIPETPPSPARQKKKPGPMSLNEYLAKRQGKPS